MPTYDVHLSAYAIVTQIHHIEADSAQEALEIALENKRYNEVWDYQGVEDLTIEGTAWDQDNQDDVAEEMPVMGLYVHDTDIS